MKADKTKVAVEIYGMQYRLSGNESDGHLRRVADLVDSQMRKIAAGYPRLDLPRLAVLAAVNIADDFLKYQEKVEQEKSGREQIRSDEEFALKRKFDELTAENGRLQASLEAAGERERELASRLDSLKEEYAKLQNEYNEWIELVGSEPAEPGK